MINRVETDAKLSDFEWILGLHALLHVLNALPVFVIECCVVVGKERGALKPVEVMTNYRRGSVAAIVQVEADFAGSGVIRILDDLLLF